MAETSFRGGSEATEPQMCNCTSGNLEWLCEIPGSRFVHPGMTSQVDPLAAVGGKKMQLSPGRDRPDSLPDARGVRAGDPYDHLARR